MNGMNEKRLSWVERQKGGFHDKNGRREAFRGRMKEKETFNGRMKEKETFMVRIDERKLLGEE